MFAELLSRFDTEILPLIYKMIFVLTPFIVVIFFIYITILLWVYYVQMKYISKLKSFLLEIKIPKDIQKSPLAMEILLASLFAGGANNYTEAYLDGKVRSWFSLEIASVEGDIRFYIWSAEQKFRKFIEAQIYAQYPTVEVHEVDPKDDYVRKFGNYDPKKNFVWGLQYKLGKDDVYPIKTYVDYGLDEDQKDEFRVDPMASVLEFMGSVGKGQQMWLQILIKRHSKEGLRDFRLYEKPDWKKAAKKEIEKIRKEAITYEGPGDETMRFPNPTKGQQETINAIERAVNKVSFYTMVRGMYVVTDLKYFDPKYITGLLAMMRHYNDENLNSFKTGQKTDTSDTYKDWVVVFPFLNKAREQLKQKYMRYMFRAYRLRSIFNPPYRHWKGKPYVLSTEELATIYHFPGNVSATPSLNKIPSKKSDAPANLPIKR